MKQQHFHSLMSYLLITAVNTAVTDIKNGT